MDLVRGKGEFVDFISAQWLMWGLGKGLIILLHGEPGLLPTNPTQNEKLSELTVLKALEKLRPQNALRILLNAHCSQWLAETLEKQPRKFRILLIIISN